MKMKLRIISDIHLEFGPFYLTPMPDDSETTLVLAGDIGVGQNCYSWIHETCTRFKHVIYVLGNHEFYGHDITDVKNFWTSDKLLPENLHVLDDTTEIIDGVRFVGGTLWTDMDNNNELMKFKARQSMNDYRRISYMGCPITPDDTIRMHSVTKAHIRETVQQKFEGKTVVVTHHLPHMECVHDKYKSSPINHAFASDLDELFSEDIDMWIHGHTHEVVDNMVQGTRIVCNPLGYIGYERGNNGTDEQMIVEL